MRHREKKRFIEKTKGLQEAALGETMYFRPFETDDEKIAEIARFAGEKKSEIVRKLVRAALAGTKFNFGGQSERDGDLKWLMHHAQQHHTALDDLARRLDEKTNHSEAIEASLASLSDRVDQLSQLAAELYCMSHTTISTLSHTYAKLLNLNSHVPDEREHGIHFASTLMVRTIENAASDLSLCIAHHKADGLNIVPDDLYIFSKVEPFKEKLGIGRGSKGQKPYGEPV